jgi:CheY-like chemotaxis protein
MPVMDGQDFHEVQKRIAPDVPIVCMTGTAKEDQASLRVGATAAHLKPIDIKVLCATIADLCGRVHPHGERQTP